jgi:hypothetical protein
MIEHVESSPAIEVGFLCENEQLKALLAELSLKNYFLHLLWWCQGKKFAVQGNEVGRT